MATWLVERKVLTNYKILQSTPKELLQTIFKSQE